MTIEAQYSIDDRSTSLFLKVIAEVMMRVKGGNFPLKNSIHMRTSYVLGGVVASFFGIVDNRKAWIVPAHDDSKNIIVWFSDEGMGGEFLSDITFCKSQDNVIPNPALCHSSYYMTTSAALDAIENHIINNKLPLSAMPLGYLQHLVG